MLETKIEKLTKAIETLTAAIEAQNDVSLPGNQAEQSKNDVSLTGNEGFIKEIGEVQKQQDITPASKCIKVRTAPSTTTHEEVKDLCLKISRSDRTKKPAIKALIAEYGATVVTQVAAESLGELKAKLEGLV